jgi:magnesium transporter
MVLGAVMGVLAAGVALAIGRGNAEALRIAVSMMLAMALNLTAGAVAGVAVPLTLRRFGQDPAVASAVFVTSITDTMGVIFFLGLYLLISR